MCQAPKIPLQPAPVGTPRASAPATRATAHARRAARIRPTLALATANSHIAVSPLPTAGYFPVLSRLHIARGTYVRPAFSAFGFSTLLREP